MANTPPRSSNSELGNIPEFSVSEISSAVKNLLETTFSRILVRGEVIECKNYPSGHIYFSLKDEGGKLSSVIWNRVATKLSLLPENGIEIIATGRLSSYGDRSTYQLIVEQLNYAGTGALLARIEQLRQKLAKEGLFSDHTKKAIPCYPSSVGVITSPQGAVLHDIYTTVARRCPMPIYLWPVAVQGYGAADQIVQAIRGFSSANDHGSVPRPDVLIIARGGGSLEDLMAFNDENVVRAVAECSLPLISAVGHETDTTLIDFVADKRAPTPTAAAEMAVPSRVELLSDLSHRNTRLIKGLRYALLVLKKRLGDVKDGLPDLPRLIDGNRQRLDDRSYRHDRAILTYIRAGSTHLNDVIHHLPPIISLISSRVAKLTLVSTNLVNTIHFNYNNFQFSLSRHSLGSALLRRLLREKYTLLTSCIARLEGVSPHAMLRRGYVLVNDRSGRAIASVKQIKVGMEVFLTFQDGKCRVKTLPGQKDIQISLDL